MNTPSKHVRLVAAALCVATLVVAGCGSDDASASKKKKDATTTTTVSGDSTTTTAGGSTPPDQPGYVTLPPVGVGDRVPPRPEPHRDGHRASSRRSSRPPARATSPVPGSSSRSRSRNDTQAAVNLDLMAVTASYGKDTPASMNRGASIPLLAGQLAPGQTKSGTYGFRVPDDAKGLITIDIQHSESPNIVIVQASK